MSKLIYEFCEKGKSPYSCSFSGQKNFEDYLAKHPGATYKKVDY
ncbi:MAG: hypothetical protein PHG24_02435 [Candidatus Pacebacteria bacterium]|nr:hypothetical protein [Candidatus Paceibacterota bacterium]